MKNKIIQCILASFAAFLWTAFAYGANLDSCAELKAWSAIKPASEEQAQQQYDTLRLYIEKCAVADTNSWDVFLNLTAADQFRSDDTNRYTQYRAWLLSVLYLNKVQPEYFCECMGAIESTYQTTIDVLAIMNYMRQFHRECWGIGNDKHYTQDSVSAANQGQGPTHLPPLDSLGLGFLLKSGVTPTVPYGRQQLESFTSSPNPFNRGTTLEFTLNCLTYITIAVYDDLGNLVWGDARGYSLEAGKHTINFEGNALPSGTLYARISTGFWEVKTIKLIHEK
jgi:hypothetical protein